MKDTFTITALKVDHPIPLTFADMKDRHERLVIEASAIRFNFYRILQCLNGQVELPRVGSYETDSTKCWNVSLCSGYVGDEFILKFSDEADANHCAKVLADWLNSVDPVRSITLPKPMEIFHSIEGEFDVDEDDEQNKADGYYYYHVSTTREEVAVTIDHERTTFIKLEHRYHFLQYNTLISTHFTLAQITCILTYLWQTLSAWGLIPKNAVKEEVITLADPRVATALLCDLFQAPRHVSVISDETITPNTSVELLDLYSITHTDVANLAVAETLLTAAGVTCQMMGSYYATIRDRYTRYYWDDSEFTPCDHDRLCRTLVALLATDRFSFTEDKRNLVDAPSLSQLLSTSQKPYVMSDNSNGMAGMLRRFLNHHDTLSSVNVTGDVS